MIAVLSGDIIESGSSGTEDDWLEELKLILKAIENKFQLVGSGARIFRGDGFQMGLKDPDQSLRASILIEAGLYSRLKLTSRIAIGLGKAESLKENVLESDGEAFRLSGRLLDNLKKERSRLALSSPFATLNSEMKVSLKLLEVIMEGWSQTDAETVWLFWMEGLTARQIQQKLGISQPAVSKRKSSAKLDEIRLLTDRFESLVKAL